LVQSDGAPGTGFAHAWMVLPTQLQRLHSPDGHSLLLRQICWAAIEPAGLGQVGAGWHDTLAVAAVVPVEWMQQICPVGQSAASSHATSVPAQAAVGAWQSSLVPGLSQQISAGTPHDASPQEMVPGVHGRPPSVG
jgi:hypothetical protein